ncbi:element excision factor XisH family protein [Moorena sp. SIO3H5]|uniref:element excision factor XisH family protein n=1 Tax=Moorena sp. SIO3H5 TaxID=2607834 RepID=UPI0013BBAC29|nr:element excision factor XisH family protein [Moorena sp. SIO3H5]NEO72808.1 hypothetical protein [Moorena sp. SIO3H5]
MAITKGTYKNYFQRQLTKMIINRNQVKLLVVDSESEVIEQWRDKSIIGKLSRKF